MPKQENSDASVTEWLNAWTNAIRANDLARGRALFHSDASGFGTVTFRTEGLEDLVTRQWSPVWANTKDFNFDNKHLVIRFSQDGRQAVVHAPWSSIGQDEKGGARRRTGRATIILVRHCDGSAWKCIHTHFSMWRDGADLILAK